MTYEQLQEILANIAVRTEQMAQNAERMAQNAERNAAQHAAELAQLKAENDRRFVENERMIKQSNKQLGELGNKLGSFAEGLAYPTVERIMLEEFKMDGVDRVLRRLGNETLEIDAFGSANGNVNKVIVGEIKSHFREEHIEQIEEICSSIYKFMPEHRGKQVNGMAIFVKGDKNAIQKAIKRGIYVVQANDDNFKLRSPEHFVPRDFAK